MKPSTVLMTIIIAGLLCIGVLAVVLTDDTSATPQPLDTPTLLSDHEGVKIFKVYDNKRHCFVYYAVATGSVSVSISVP